MSIRILLVDDHPVLRMGLHTAISRDATIEVVGEASDGAEGVEMAHKLRPDIVLMDIQMPVLNGVDATRQIVRELPAVKVIMLTMHKEENHELAALRVGAMGYVYKDSDPGDLLKAIHTVAGGAPFLPPQVAQRVLAKLHEDEESTQQTPNISLTERETYLLQLIKAGRSNKEIATELGLSDSRVRTQLSDLYQKIQVSSRTQAAMYAVEQRLL